MRGKRRRERSGRVESVTREWVFISDERGECSRRFKIKKGKEEESE